jgi:homoserine dehydrogenase
LLAHSFGLFVHEKDVFHSGISNVSNFDFQYAAKNNASIKLIAGAYKKDNMVKAYVIPKFIPDSNMFYNVKNEFNAVQLEAAFSDKQFFYGKGAGAFPTASAVLADISALNYQYKYEYKKHFSDTSLSFSNDVALNVYIRYKEKSQLEKLEFESIDEQHTINQTNYIIAKVKLKSLIENNVNEWQDFFVAAL